jgi:hypothetical protein
LGLKYFVRWLEPVGRSATLPIEQRRLWQTGPAQSADQSATAVLHTLNHHHQQVHRHSAPSPPSPPFPSTASAIPQTPFHRQSNPLSILPILQPLVVPPAPSRLAELLHHLISCNPSAAVRHVRASLLCFIGFFLLLAVAERSPVRVCESSE